jgi:indolepyruvate ferredoxin oxidoreductase
MQDVSLDDKYTLESGRIFITGSQALVRLPIIQRLRDEKVGLNTAGFISGYLRFAVVERKKTFGSASHPF